MTGSQPGGSANGPLGQAPAYQAGQPGGAGQVVRSGARCRRGTGCGVDHPGLVTDAAGTQAATASSPTADAPRTDCRSCTHAHHASGALPQATSMAWCGGLSRYTATPGMTSNCTHVRFQVLREHEDPTARIIRCTPTR